MPRSTNRPPLADRRGLLLMAPATIAAAAGLCLAEAPREERSDSPAAVSSISARDIEGFRGLSDAQLARLAAVSPAVALGGDPSAAIRGLDASAFIRTRYTASQRDDDLLGDDETTLGFSQPLIEVTLAGAATENIGGVVSFVTRESTNGEFQLENAFVNWKFSSDYSLQVGQFMPAFRRENMVHESELGGLSRTIQNNFFGGGYQQGFQIAKGFDESSQFWWSGYISDGPGSDNSEFDASSEYDLTIGGRLEFRPYGTWSQFTDVTAFRGTEQGLLFGLGGYIAWDGDTNPSSVNDQTVCGFTLDGNYEGDGFRFGASFDWLRDDTDGSPEIDTFGWGLEGGVFVSDQTEVFARVEQILADSDLMLANDDFLFARFGVNHFLIPGSHAARISADLGYAFDETAALSGLGAPGASVIGGSSTTGFVGSSNDGEVTFRLQLQGRF